MKTLRILILSLFMSASVASSGEVVATDVASAENAMQTSNQRLFVSSNGAFFELIHDSAGWAKQQVPAPFKDAHSGQCYFVGITETGGTLYTVCTENNLNPFAKKHLFGINIDQSVAQLTEVGEIRGTALPNGLAADSSGNLYIVDSGFPFLPGAIRKVTLASTYAIATQSRFYQFVLCKPNGLKYSDGKLYVTTDPPIYVGVSQLLRYDLDPDGLSNKAVIYKSFGFLDDFDLVKGGAVIAEHFGGAVTHVDESGHVLHQTTGLSQPTSAILLTAPAFGLGSLLVTEAGNKDVLLLENTWGLQPR